MRSQKSDIRNGMQKYNVSYFLLVSDFLLLISVKFIFTLLHPGKICGIIV